MTFPAAAWPRDEVEADLTLMSIPWRFSLVHIRPCAPHCPGPIQPCTSLPGAYPVSSPVHLTARCLSRPVPLCPGPIQPCTSLPGASPALHLSAQCRSSPAPHCPVPIQPCTSLPTRRPLTDISEMLNVDFIFMLRPTPISDRSLFVAELGRGLTCLCVYDRNFTYSARELNMERPD